MVEKEYAVNLHDKKRIKLFNLKSYQYRDNPFDLCYSFPHRTSPGSGTKLVHEGKEELIQIDHVSLHGNKATICCYKNGRKKYSKEIANYQQGFLDTSQDDEYKILCEDIYDVNGLKNFVEDKDCKNFIDKCNGTNDGIKTRHSYLTSNSKLACSAKEGTFLKILIVLFSSKYNFKSSLSNEETILQDEFPINFLSSKPNLGVYVIETDSIEKQQYLFYQEYSDKMYHSFRLPFLKNFSL